MSAQPSISVILAYGPQGERQAGTAALLSYSPPPAVPRRVVATFGAPWGASAPLAVDTGSPMHHTDPLDSAVCAHWGEGHAVHRSASAAWDRPATLCREQNAPWQQFASRLQPQSSQPWGVAHQQDAASHAPWGQFSGRPALSAVAVWVRALVSDQQATAPWGEYASRPAMLMRAVWAMSRRADAEHWIPWTRYSRVLQPGWGIVVPDGGGTPGSETITIPVRRVYIVQNNTTLIRVSDNATVPCLSMSLSLDADSWTWGFSAQLPATAQALVEPNSGPVELQATVNGTVFRVLAESVSRERTFGQISIRVSGRGRNAMLDAPYSPQQFFSNAAPRTHQQLFDDVLTLNGVSLGYTIDYALEDWLVPAGVFDHQGTYISALSALAQAAGGYLIPHTYLDEFKVAHRYPTKPWETIVPDFVLPADVLVSESIAWQEKPSYNRVYVSGQSGGGVLGRVTRAGTAGGILAPMITDALITDAVAARQRGLAVLGDTGRKLALGISLPVLPETGVIGPGMYVQYLDGSITRTGIVRSTNVTVDGFNVKQSLGVEVHA